MINVKLSQEIINELRTRGMTSARAGQLIGVGPRQACHLLKKAGAKQGENFPRLWRMAQCL